MLYGLTDAFPVHGQLGPEHAGGGGGGGGGPGGPGGPGIGAGITFPLHTSGIVPINASPSHQLEGPIVSHWVALFNALVQTGLELSEQ